MSHTSVAVLISYFSFLFFFNDPATTEIYTLSLHDALPIYVATSHALAVEAVPAAGGDDLVVLAVVEADGRAAQAKGVARPRSEEHTSELQSRLHLVCRLLLEKKKKKKRNNHNSNDY